MIRYASPLELTTGSRKPLSAPLSGLYFCALGLAAEPPSYVGRIRQLHRICKPRYSPHCSSPLTDILFSFLCSYAPAPCYLCSGSNTYLYSRVLSLVHTRHKCHNKTTTPPVPRTDRIINLSDSPRWSQITNRRPSARSPWLLKSPSQRTSVTTTRQPRRLGSRVV